jgi:3-oxoacyl-(acyl-carrier-protein) synthase
MNGMRRVVVTGLGMVCPLGASAQESWDNLLAKNNPMVRFTEEDDPDWEQVSYKTGAPPP